MDGEKTEGCGIIGIAHGNDAAQDIYYSLRILQHRGQESAGIAVYDKGIECVKGMGLVEYRHRACQVLHHRNIKTGERPAGCRQDKIW
jgi:amidophosphoribosyltransferase